MAGMGTELSYPDEESGCSCSAVGQRPQSALHRPLEGTSFNGSKGRIKVCENAKIQALPSLTDDQDMASST